MREADGKEYNRNSGNLVREFRKFSCEMILMKRKYVWQFTFCLLAVTAIIWGGVAPVFAAVPGDAYLQAGFTLMKTESIGPLRIDDTDTTVLKVLGEPEEKSGPTVWAADGNEHQSWQYPQRGLKIGMVRKNNGQVVDRIAVQSPCDWKTTRGIGIGSAEAEVRTTYRSEINPNSKDLVAGSVYGGIIFRLSEGQVSYLFIGAAAE